jgi:hypothetical protein
MQYVIVKIQERVSGQNVGTIYLVVDTTTLNGFEAVARTLDLTTAVAIRDALNGS